MAIKYPGYNKNDTSWDNYQRERGMMTNREFFTSNGQGGFYEGMQWDEEEQEWYDPNAVNEESEYCHICHNSPCYCDGEY